MKILFNKNNNNDNNNNNYNYNNINTKYYDNFIVNNNTR